MKSAFSLYISFFLSTHSPPYANSYHEQIHTVPRGDTPRKQGFQKEALFHALYIPPFHHTNGNKNIHRDCSLEKERTALMYVGIYTNYTPRSHPVDAHSCLETRPHITLSVVPLKSVCPTRSAQKPHINACLGILLCIKLFIPLFSFL